VKLLLAARKSNKVDGSGQAIGIETQDQRAREWALREGHEIIGVAVDIKSGVVAPWDRRNLKPWVTGPEKLALYDGVLAFKTDRLSRGTQEDFTRIEHWATEHGKKLVIVDGPQYPARDDSDYWQWAATKREARREWENIRERSMRAQAGIRDNGGFVGKPPWGYVTTGDKYRKTIIPTDEGRMYIPEIFRRVIKGDSLATIAAWLSAETDRNWWARSIGAMVRNSTYIGHVTDGSGRIVHECEAIVDAGIFQRAAKRLDNAPKRGKILAENRAMLAGAAFCPCCQDTLESLVKPSPMYRINGANTRKDGSKGSNYYYRCSGRGPQRKGCGNMVPVHEADMWVDEVIRKHWDKPVITRKLIPGHNHDAEIAGVEYQLRELAKQGYDEDEEDKRRMELRAEKKRLMALPAVPDKWADVEGDMTYAAEWAATPVNGRGAWLAEHGIMVMVAKPEYGRAVAWRDRAA
jgi:DNA invertase Pin-like site-specific DNA recombinase